MSFASKNTPVLAPDNGYQTVPTGGADLLRSVLPAGLPADASGAWLQGDGADFAYTLNGDTGVDPNAFITVVFPAILVLTNREQIVNCVLSGGPDVHVQFFAGQVGTAEHTW